MCKQKIIISKQSEKIELKLLEEKEGNTIEKLRTKAFVGKNGITDKKVEGDLKTPRGTFNIGISFGTYDKINNKKIKYIKITPNLYWIDDSDSAYYNQLVDITKVPKDWKHAEHLAEYPIQYEYAIEIKTNPQNKPNRGSAIFIHCSNGNQTAGCVSIERNDMKKLIEMIDENAVVTIL